MPWWLIIALLLAKAVWFFRDKFSLRRVALSRTYLIIKKYLIYIKKKNCFFDEVTSLIGENFFFDYRNRWQAQQYSNQYARALVLSWWTIISLLLFQSWDRNFTTGERTKCSRTCLVAANLGTIVQNHSDLMQMGNLTIIMSKLEPISFTFTGT